MKNIKTGLLFLTVLCVTTVFSAFYLKNISYGSEELFETPYTASLQDGVYRPFDASGYIQLGSSVYIYNLSLAEKTYDWVTGNGSVSNPYVINGINVDNVTDSAALALLDAEFVVIKNCSFSNVFATGGHYEYAGIFIHKTENVLIENCVFFNTYIGIAIIEAKENTVVNNNTFIGFHNGTSTGIAIEQEAKNVTITNNDILNFRTGICAIRSEGIYAENNSIENTLYGHMALGGAVAYREVNGGSIKDNDFYGVSAISDTPVEGLLISGLKTSSGASSAISLIGCINIQVSGNVYHEKANVYPVLFPLEIVLAVVVSCVVVLGSLIVVHKIKR